MLKETYLRWSWVNQQTVSVVDSGQAGFVHCRHKHLVAGTNLQVQSFICCPLGGATRYGLPISPGKTKQNLVNLMTVSV